MRHCLFFLPFFIAVLSCNQNTSGNEGQSSTTLPAPAQAPAATLPSVPLKLLEDIWKEGSQVDYIFYNYPFTMSLTDTASIRYAVRHIAENPAPLKPECKPAGRVTYQIKGNIVLEGDFYFSTGCTYFVFEESRQKKFSNYMTDEGITYFNNQIQQALKMQQNMQQ